MFTAVAIWKKMDEQLSPVTHKELPVAFASSAGEIFVGFSLAYTWTSTGCAALTGFLWIAVYQLQRRDIKLLETQENDGNFEHSYCCSHVM